MVDICSFFKHCRGLLYPGLCTLCGAAGPADADLCSACRRELPWSALACRRCALPLPAGAGSARLCARCLQHPPAQDSAWAPFRYVQPLRHLHQRLKFRGQLPQARVLGQLFAEALAAALANGSVARPGRVMVMPLHPQRLRRRGFNQALELIRPAAEQMQLPLDLDSCRRLRATRPQTGLSAGQRRRNVRGAFACDAELGGQAVAIFDDVVTTGHTVAELARVLKRAGAAEVSVWSLARAV